MKPSQNRLLKVLLASWLVLASCAVARAEDAAAIEKRITASVQFLASDELEGRGIGTKGVDRAAEFIAAELAKCGLRQDAFAGTPYQKFSVALGVRPGPNNRLALVGPVKDAAKPQRLELKPDEDFNPLAAGGSGSFDLPLVFAGYGITGQKEGYDDYAGIDVAGKAVVILRREPQQDDPKSVFAGTNPSEHALITRKLANAAEHKAAAVVLCDDEYDVRRTTAAAHKRWQGLLDKLTESHAGFKKAEDPSFEQINAQLKRIDDLTRQAAAQGDLVRKAQDPLLPFQGVGRDNEGREFPVVHCRRSVLDQVVRSAAGTDLAAFERKIDSGPTPQSRILEGWKVVGQTDLDRSQAEAKNVVAVLEGQGPLAQQTIVVGAHYDHIGFGRPDRPGGPKPVMNGADDNASGVAVMLEVARQLGQLPQKLPRRVVFVGFAAEEVGLRGSFYYVDHPAFPLEKTVAMVNLDMVGRLKDDRLAVLGTGTAARLSQLVDEVNQHHQFKITKVPLAFGGSDHMPFQRRKVPAVHVFTGLHEDRHRPTDDWEKLNVPGMRRIAAMVTELIVALANSKDRP